MNETLRTLSALLVLASVATVVAAPSDDVDLISMDDAADAAAARPIVSTGTGAPGVVDVSCDNATIANVIRQFRLATKANIISPDTTNLERRVSVELKRVPWLEAFRSILNSRNFRLEERGNIYYVEEAFDKVLTRSYILNHASAEELADLFNGYALKSERTVTKDGKSESTIKSVESQFSALSGKVRASAFPNANVLVLCGTESDLQECESILKAIDRAATQVYIEARFLELSSSAKHQLGMKWDSLKQVGLTASDNKLSNEISVENDTVDGNTLSTLFRNIGAFPATYAGKYSGTLSATDFSLFLSAFEEVGGSQVFSNPKVIISNGKEANIDMTTKFPNLKITSQRNTTSGQTYTDYTAQLEEIQGDKDKGLFAGSAFFSWGISLLVKPRISPEGLISVKITPSISELDTDVTSDGFYQVQGGSSGDEAKDQAAYGKYPIIRMKSISTDFTMKDGCTAVIGGLSRTTEADVDNGIPYLRKIPWIGPHLFGWKSREKVQMEIIICVTIGIANPQELKKDVGLPKNAVLSREHLDGPRAEPGDRPNPAKDLHTLDTRPLEKAWENPYPDRDEAVDLEEPEEKTATVAAPASSTEPVKELLDELEAEKPEESKSNPVETKDAPAETNPEPVAQPQPSPAAEVSPAAEPAAAEPTAAEPTAAEPAVETTTPQKSVNRRH